MGPKKSLRSLKLPVFGVYGFRPHDLMLKGVASDLARNGSKKFESGFGGSFLHN